MIKHYSKDAVPLPKIEYKKESGGNGYNPGDGEYGAYCSASMNYLVKALKREMFIDDAICEVAAKAAFDEGFTDVYFLNSDQVKQALREYWERESQITAKRIIEPIHFRAKFSIKKGFCTPERVNCMAVKCMMGDLTKRVKVKMIEDRDDRSVFEAELDVLDKEMMD